MSETALQVLPAHVPEKFRENIQGSTPQILELLPRDVTFPQFQAGLLLEFTTTPKLADCTPASLVKATIRAAMKGHVPGRDCFMLPFKRQPKGREPYYEASMVEYYQGIVRALDRTGRVTWAKAEPVYKADHFVCDELAEQYEFRRHIDGERGKLRCYFSAVKLNGADKPLVRVCTVEEVEKVRRAAPGGEQDAWLKWPEEMGKKTALKKHAKYLQLVPEYDEEEEQQLPAIDHTIELFGDNAADALKAARHPNGPPAQLQQQPEAVPDMSEPESAQSKIHATREEWVGKQAARLAGEAEIGVAPLRDALDNFMIDNEIEFARLTPDHFDRIKEELPRIVGALVTEKDARDAEDEAPPETPESTGNADVDVWFYKQSAIENQPVATLKQWIQDDTPDLLAKAESITPEDMPYYLGQLRDILDKEGTAF